MVWNNLNLIIPPVGTTAQDWARMMNANFARIDYHNHTDSQGTHIDSISLSGGDLDLNGVSLTNISRITFNDNAITPPTYSLFTNNTFGDLFYQSPQFTLQITSGIGLNLTDIPQGFTVVGVAPVAVFDPDVAGIRFFSSLGNDTSTLQTDILNCRLLTSSGTVIVDTTSNLSLQSKVDKSKLFGVNRTAGVNTNRTFIASWKAYETADIYKISEKGDFYVDALPYNPATSYDLSYTLGAKNWVATTNVEKVQKFGTRYYFETRAYPVGKIVSQTFTVVPNLSNGNLVSFIPKIETNSAERIGYNNALLKSLPMPVFDVIFQDNAVLAFVSFNLSTLPITDSVTLRFNVIYADKNFSSGDVA